VYRKELETAFIQVGFARVISDEATFAYLADVFVLEKYQGMGLSKWLIQEIMGYKELQGLRGCMLGTKDAHGLYEQLGFKPLQKPTTCNEIKCI
jgi:GNAT superfamily N-acetyltransferase